MPLYPASFAMCECSYSVLSKYQPAILEVVESEPNSYATHFKSPAELILATKQKGFVRSTCQNFFRKDRNYSASGCWPIFTRTVRDVSSTVVHAKGDYSAYSACPVNATAKHDAVVVLGPSYAVTFSFGGTATIRTQRRKNEVWAEPCPASA
jgi:hypothetical protein